jgi:hypothetical protein
VCGKGLTPAFAALIQQPLELEVSSSTFRRGPLLSPARALAPAQRVSIAALAPSPTLRKPRTTGDDDPPFSPTPYLLCARYLLQPHQWAPHSELRLFLQSGHVSFPGADISTEGEGNTLIGSAGVSLRVVVGRSLLGHGIFPAKGYLCPKPPQWTFSPGEPIREA